MDRSRSRTLSLACRCGAATEHRHWDVIEAALRPDLVDQLKSGQLGRTDCSACGRALVEQEPVSVLRVLADGPLLLVFAEEEPDEVPTVPGLELPWHGAPFEAAPIMVDRDLDADMEDIHVAAAEVSRHYGPDAGSAYQQWLRGLAHGADPYDLIDVLSEVRDVDLAGFERLLAAHPEYLSADMRESTDRKCMAFPEYAIMLRACHDLMVEARTDPASALAAFRARVGQVEQDFAALGPLVSRLEAAHAAGRFDEVIADGPAVVATARALGAVLAVGYAANIVGDALLTAPGPDRATSIDTAIDLLRESLDYADTDVERVERGMSLARAFLERPSGDRGRNIDEAILLLREAMDAIGDADPDRLAWIQSNLAHTFSIRQNGERIENLTTAHRLCQEALVWRTPERGVEDWAFTQLNLGMVLDHLAHLGRGHHRDARRAWAAILPYAAQLPDELVSTVRTNIARLARQQPRRAWTRRGRRRRLRDARDQLVDQLAGLEHAGPVARGRAMRELAEMEDRLGDRAAAIAHSEAALHELRPDLVPAESLAVATSLAPRLAEDERWSDAAIAWGDAVTASAFLFYGTHMAEDREAFARESGNLSRWAAFAMARAGDARRAALTLEDGRTRELRLRLGADDEQLAALRAVAPELHAEYKQVLADLVRADLIDDSDATATRHQQLLGRIRELPGLDRFAGSVSWAAVLAAVGPDQLLMYVNPTPWGTVLLTVTGDEPVRTRFLDVTSAEIMERLMLGLGDGPDQVTPSYLAAAAADSPGIDIALACALPWIGETVARWIADELCAQSATGCALVLSGLLNQFPVHVARWRANTGDRTLADEFDITFAPSASLHAAARRRAAERARTDTVPRLVAIADPRAGPRSLPASRAEVTAISAHFGPDGAEVAMGPDATAAFLRRRAAVATHLHLACHASGALFDFRDAGLELADGDLPLTDLARIGPLTSRVAVASACQTGMPDAALGDEGYSIAAILIAAGSACAIASLWSVDDLATAVLMTKLYEELLDGGGRSPVDALRRAQTWLRELPRAEVESFLAAHPSLDGERARRRGAGLEVVPDGELPFAEPGYWAAFIVMGA
jgi:CHAT domain-containing protein